MRRARSTHADRLPSLAPAEGAAGAACAADPTAARPASATSAAMMRIQMRRDTRSPPSLPR